MSRHRRSSTPAQEGERGDAEDEQGQQDPRFWRQGQGVLIMETCYLTQLIMIALRRLVASSAVFYCPIPNTAGAAAPQYALHGGPDGQDEHPNGEVLWSRAGGRARSRPFPARACTRGTGDGAAPTARVFPPCASHAAGAASAARAFPP